MYLVYTNSFANNTTTFDNRFTAFDFVKSIFQFNDSLDIRMVCVKSGFIFNLDFLKGDKHAA